MAEQQEKQEGLLSKTGVAIWMPVLAIYLLFLVGKVTEVFGKTPDEMPEVAEFFLEPDLWLKLGFSLAILLIATVQLHARHATHRIFHGNARFDLLRSGIALFFFMYAVIVAKGMVPLPDEPPRINFWGVFCAVVGMVIAFQALVSDSRSLLVWSSLFLVWVAFGQLEKRLKFLEMMLEPLLIEKLTYCSLGLVLLALLTPRSLRTYHRLTPLEQKQGSLLLKKGFPF